MADNNNPAERRPQDREAPAVRDGDETDERPAEYVGGDLPTPDTIVPEEHDEN